MSARPAFRRPRVLAAAAATIALAASLAVAAPAEATGGGFPALQPRTYAASLITPTGAITRGVDTPFQIKVTNTSTAISALDRIRVKVPEGFTVTSKGTVAFPRPGWSESLSGSTLTIATNKPLTSALRKGEMLTFTFTAKATPTSCAAMPSTWPLNVDGIFLVYTSPGATPITTTVPAVADTFVLNSVDDVDTVLPGKQVNKDVPFSASGDFLCAGSSAPAGSAGSVTLSTTSTGHLGGTSASFAATDTTATFNAVTYDQAENDVTLAATWNSAASGSVTVDVLGANQTAPASNGAIALTVPGGSANLGKGSNTPVSLAVVACGDTSDDPVGCSGGTEIALTGDFKGRYGFGVPAVVVSNPPLANPLLAPASLTWGCETAACPHHDTTSVLTNPPGTPNPDCKVLFSCYQSSSKPFGLRDVEEDFADYPVWVSMADGHGDYKDFAKAGRCVSTPSISEDDWWKFSSYLTARSHFLHTTGVIEDPLAQAAGFCVDVNSITRDSTGLHIPVLFVEDPRLRP